MKQSSQIAIKKLVTPVLVLSLAAGSAWQLMASTPKSKRSAPPKVERLVDVYIVDKHNQNVVIKALGTVVADKLITLYPEVSGRVSLVRNSLYPGASFSIGERLVELDSEEYQIAVQEQQASVTKAQADFTLELGRQSIAKKEYALTQHNFTDKEKALVLRQPQLESAKATVKQAKSALRQAQLEVERTTIFAPFNGQVIENHAHIGSRVSTSSELMQIVATDRFLLEVELPTESTQWLVLGENASSVRVTSRAWGNAHREGTVLSIAPNVDEKSQLSTVIVAIDDPLALSKTNQGSPRVSINDLLEVEITGLVIEQAVALPNELLRNSDQIWILDDQNQLEIRTIAPLFRSTESVFVLDELNTGERIVSSYLGMPIAGMPLKTVSPTSDEGK